MLVEKITVSFISNIQLTDVLNNSRTRTYFTNSFDITSIMSLHC